MKIPTFDEFMQFILPTLNDILDFSIKIWYIFLALFLLIIFIIIMSIKKRKSEDRPINVLLTMLDSNKYKVINDLLFSTGERTIHIDHLVISNFGIFVIDVKDGSGKIYGHENDDYWTLAGDEGKEKIFNPIKQNNVNIKALKDIFEYYFHFAYIPMIVFSSDLKLKVKSETDVIYSSKLLSEIKKYNIICISEEEKDMIFEKLISLKI